MAKKCFDGRSLNTGFLAESERTVMGYLQRCHYMLTIGGNLIRKSGEGERTYRPWLTTFWYDPLTLTETSGILREFHEALTSCLTSKNKASETHTHLTQG